MTGRAFIIIFLFWALLTIVTPMLILLSENSKADFSFKVRAVDGMNARKMMNYTHANPITTPAVDEVGDAPVPAPSPAQSSNSSGASESSSLSRLYRSNKNDSTHGFLYSRLKVVQNWNHSEV